MVSRKGLIVVLEYCEFLKDIGRRLPLLDEWEDTIKKKDIVVLEEGKSLERLEGN